MPYDDLVAAEPHPLVPRSADDLGALMYTGGTTGRAKGVMLSHGNLWWCGRCAYERGRDTYDGKPSLTALPLSHAFGMIVTIVGTFIEEQRGPSVLMRWFEPAGWLRLAAEHRVGAGQLVPSMLALLLQQPVEEHDLSELGYLSVGAAPLPAAVRAEWERRVPGAALLEGYGCTESGAVISSSTLDDRRSGSVGRPLPRYQVRVVDDAGRDVPAGTDGEIWVRGPGVMTGYWNDPRDHRRHPRRGLAAHRRRRSPRRRRLPLAGRPEEGPHHPQRGERLPPRRGGGAARASGHRRGGGRRPAGPGPRRGGGRVRRAPPRRDAWTRPRSRRSRRRGCPASTARTTYGWSTPSRSPAWARPTARPCGRCCSHPDDRGRHR